MANDMSFVPPECRDDFNREAQRIHFDPEAYAHHLADFDLSDAQKDIMLRAVWDILVAFADAGFEIDTVSLSKETTEPNKQEERKDRSP